MRHETVYSALSPVVNIAHLVWEDGSAPAHLPWAVFYLDETSDMCADNDKYIGVNNWIVELYQETRDGELEEDIEEAIRSNFSPARKMEEWVSSQNCLMTTYYFTEIERNQNG